MTTAGTAAQGATSLQQVGLGNYGSTYLIVLKIDFNTSGANDTITIYTNPVANASAPGVTAAGTYSSYDVGTISGVGLNVQGAANITVDEIRVGDTYGDVVGYVSTPPNPPTGLSATPGANLVSLSWTAATGSPTSYNVKRSTVSGGPYTTVGTTTAPTVTYTDSVLGGQTYYYVVTAVNGGRRECQQFGSLCVAHPRGAGRPHRAGGNRRRRAGGLKLDRQFLCDQLQCEESHRLRRALHPHWHHDRSHGDVHRFQRAQQRHDLLLRGVGDGPGRDQLRHFASERHTRLSHSRSDHCSGRGHYLVCQQQCDLSGPMVQRAARHQHRLE